MKGTDVTEGQMKAAEEFVRQRAVKSQPDGLEQRVSLRFSDLVRLVAWYGALRYQAGAEGINSLENPGELYTARKQGEEPN